MAINTGLLTRPWSCHVPKAKGYEPAISGKVERVSLSKKYGWRSEALVGGVPMAISHHGTKAQAESACERMMEAYTEVHYRSR
jgi:hypothetical protein